MDELVESSLVPQFIAHEQREKLLNTFESDWRYSHIRSDTEIITRHKIVDKVGLYPLLDIRVSLVFSQTFLIFFLELHNKL